MKILGGGARSRSAAFWGKADGRSSCISRAPAVSMRELLQTSNRRVSHMVLLQHHSDSWLRSGTAGWLASLFVILCASAWRVAADAPVITLQPASRTNQGGSTAVFHAEAIGTGPLTFSWRHGKRALVDGDRISGAASGTLTIADVRLSDAGRYSLRVSNAEGNAISTVATLTVLAPETVVIPDANLEAAFRMAINKPQGTITAGDLAGLTSLSVPFRGVVDLSGLEWATNLISLDLAGNAITDVSPLDNISRLAFLSLEANRINDLSPLVRLFTLTNLNVGDNLISDTSALEGLTNLTSLSLYHNQIHSLAPLTNLSGLQVLMLCNSGIAEIEPLAALSNLNRLGLRWNPLTGGQVLASLTNLTALFLGGTSVSNLSFLQHLPRLEFLDLHDAGITDLSPLSALPALRGLDASHNPLTNLAQVAVLTNLTGLFLSGQALGDLDALTNLSRLTSLELFDSRVIELSPLAGLTALETLGLGRNPVSDYATLGRLTNLTSLRLDGNAISNLAFVPGGFTALKSFNVRSNRLSDLTALGGLTNLSAVLADYNLLQDLAVFDELPRLAKVQVAGNLLDLSPGGPSLAAIQNLQDRGVGVTYLPQNGPPSFSVLTNWIIAADAPASLDFEVFDDLTPVGWLQVTASSSNPELIPDANLRSGGTNQNRTLAVTPLPGGIGTAVIALKATDDAGLNSVATVAVTVMAPQAVVIPDPNLEAALRLVLEQPSGDLTNAAIASLTQLSFDNTNIFNLSGLEWASNLAVLYLNVNALEDLGVLRQLTRLESLSIHCNSAVDLSPLAGLTNLKSLELSGHPIAGLGFLQGLGGLTSLGLVRVGLSDVAPLAAMTNLVVLDLQQNRLAEVGPLTNLAHLRYLDVRLNLLETPEAGPLASLRERGVTVVDQPQRGPPAISIPAVWIVAVDVASTLTFRLEDEVTPSGQLGLAVQSSNPALMPNSSVELGGINRNRTLTVTPAVNQTGTALITLTATNDADLVAAAQVLVVVVVPEVVAIPDPYLEAGLRLALDKPLGDLTSVDLVSLTELHLDSTNLFDLSGLERATNLTVLSLELDAVTSLEPLQHLPHLQSLRIQSGSALDYSPLAGLPRLTHLDLTDNSIGNLDFLDQLSALTDLSLVNCRLTNIARLAALTNLVTLELRQNRLAEIGVLTNLLNLELIDVRLNLLGTNSEPVLQYLRDRDVIVLDQPQRAPPALVAAPDWFVSANTVSFERLTVWNDGPAGEHVAITAASSDTNLVADAHLTFTPDANGRPQDWMVTIAPPTNYTGTSTIELIALSEVSFSATATVTLTISAPLPLDQVLNDGTRNWLTDGGSIWFGQTNVSHDGVSSAQSGSTLDGRDTWLAANFEGPGRLSFWWKISSEPDLDELELYLDDVLQDYRISGEVDWEQVKFNLPAGNHTLAWRYYKNERGAVGMDAAWVDEITVTNVPPVILSLSVADSTNLVITWSAVSNLTYRVQYRSGLNAEWLDTLPEVRATANSASAVVPSGGSFQRFYRVWLVE